MKLKQFAVVAVAGIVALGILLQVKFSENVGTVSDTALLEILPTSTAYATAVPSVSFQVMQKITQGEILTQEAHGVEVSAANFRVENDQLKVDVCYQMPAGVEWVVSNVVAKVGDREILYRESRTIELSQTLKDGTKQIVLSSSDSPSGITVQTLTKADANNVPDYRCNTVIFKLESDMTVSDVIVTLHELRVSWDEGEVCESYFQDVQSILDVEKTGIRLDCVTQEYGEFMSIAEKPASMSDKEAQRLLDEAKSKVNIIEGPWIFEGKIE